MIDMMSNILIVYFSGTGGTKRIADSFEIELLKRNLLVKKCSLDYSIYKENCSSGTLPEEFDLLLLIFPVHAFDAPQPVYEWIMETKIAKMKTAVISVSGGGEVWPNTGCRNNCCKVLEEKGFEVVYEKMMVMPSNFLIKANDHTAMWLIQAVPEKVNKIVDRLIEGKTRRTHFKKGFIRSYISKLEKKNANRFAKKIKINNNCSGCGLCIRHCPVKNITWSENKPVFNDWCVACCKCIYGCPNKAMVNKSFMVFKEGFSLDEVEKRIAGTDLEPISKCTKGIMWKAVRDYLLDKDGY